MDHRPHPSDRRWLLRAVISWPSIPCVNGGRTVGLAAAAMAVVGFGVIFAGVVSSVLAGSGARPTVG